MHIAFKARFALFKNIQIGIKYSRSISLMGFCPLDLFDIKEGYGNTVTLIFFILYT